MIEKKLKSFKTFMDRWGNSNVKVSEIVWAGIHIKVEKFDREGYFQIVCINPVEIYGVLQFYEGTLSLSYEGNVYILEEKNKNFKVYCNDIELKEFI